MDRRGFFGMLMGAVAAPLLKWRAPPPAPEQEEAKMVREVFGWESGEFKLVNREEIRSWHDVPTTAFADDVDITKGLPKFDIVFRTDVENL